MKPLDVAALAEELLRKAKRLLRRHGDLQPVAFIVHAGGVETVGLQFKDADEKHQAYVVVSKMCRTLRADAVILINEVWLGQSRSGESRDETIARAEALPPSEDPRRQEAITLTILGPGFKPTLTILPSAGREGRSGSRKRRRWRAGRSRC